jgi:hypothetical protein
MKTRKSFFTNPLVLATLGILTVAAACSSDNTGSPTPGGGSKATGGSGGTSSTGGKTGTAGKSSAAGAGNSPAMGGSGTDMAGAAGVGGAPGPGCNDSTDMGCYSCKPKTLTQFLNACPTSGCEPFDNGKLTSIKAGKLPPLP